MAITNSDTNKKVAVIEDDEILTRFLTEGLAEGGFQVLKANNGKDGLDLVLKEHPDLILLDIAMPSMNGLAMLTELRKDASWGKTAPVVILSNYDDPNKISESVAHGVKFYFVKVNWKVEDLVMKVKEILDVK